jgi:hypothetical protein
MFKFLEYAASLPATIAGFLGFSTAPATTGAEAAASMHADITELQRQVVFAQVEVHCVGCLATDVSRSIESLMLLPEGTVDQPLHSMRYFASDIQFHQRGATTKLEKLVAELEALQVKAAAAKEAWAKVQVNQSYDAE